MAPEPATDTADAMYPAAPAQPAAALPQAPQPPAPMPLVRVHLACCDDGGVRVVLAVVGEEWVRLELQCSQMAQWLPH
jgi:hypothetical protein